jgi:hypothetical protein
MLAPKERLKGSMPPCHPTGWMWSDACEMLEQRRAAALQVLSTSLAARGEENY